MLNILKYFGNGVILRIHIPPNTLYYSILIFIIFCSTLFLIVDNDAIQFK